MAEPHVATALVAKRAELSGEIVKLDKRRAAIKAHIAKPRPHRHHLPPPARRPSRRGAGTSGKGGNVSDTVDSLVAYPLGCGWSIRSYPVTSPRRRPPGPSPTMQPGRARAI